MSSAEKNLESLPHVPRSFGRLNNGNPSGDFTQATRCGARTKSGGICSQPAMRNGRCRFHGGKSTGAKTTEGKVRSARANYRHGEYSYRGIENNRKVREYLDRSRLILLKMELLSRQILNSDLVAASDTVERLSSIQDLISKSEFSLLAVIDSLNTRQKLTFIRGHASLNLKFTRLMLGVLQKHKCRWDNLPSEPLS